MTDKIYINKKYKSGVQFAMSEKSDEYHIEYISVEALQDWIDEHVKNASQISSAILLVKLEQFIKEK